MNRLQLDRFAEAMTAGRPFDVVTLDLTIPGGMETIRELRRLDPNVRAVVSSGYADAPVTANSRDFGFVAVAPKPYSPATLARAIEEALKSPPPDQDVWTPFAASCR